MCDIPNCVACQTCDQADIERTYEPTGTWIGSGPTMAQEQMNNWEDRIIRARRLAHVMPLEPQIFADYITDLAIDERLTWLALQVEECHSVMDEAGIPTEENGESLTLMARFQYARG